MNGYPTLTRVLPTRVYWSDCVGQYEHCQRSATVEVTLQQRPIIHPEDVGDFAQGQKLKVRQRSKFSYGALVS